MSPYLPIAAQGWTALALGVAFKSLVVLAGAGAIALALRRAPAAARHLVWSLALGGTLALPPLAGVLPAWSWSVLPLPAGRGVSRPVMSKPAAPMPAREGPAPRIGHDLMPDRPVALAMSPPSTLSPPSGRQPVPTPRTSPWPAWAWLLGVWSAVAVPLLAAPWFGRLGLRRIAQRATILDRGAWVDLMLDLGTRLRLRRRLTLLRSDRAVMPMTWGWLRPVVLLPAGAEDWPRERLCSVLLHELAHVRRLDCLTQSIAQIACAVYWFNPLAWRAARRMRIERERACDDLVLTAGARPSEYAGHLLEMARGLRSHRAAAVAAVAMARAGPSHLEGRLRAILDPKIRRGGPSRGAMALAATGLAALLLPLSAIRLSAQNAEPVRGGAAVNASTTETDRTGTGTATRTTTMIVTGRVLDPDGKPVRAAAIDLVARPRNTWVGASVDDDRFTVLGQGETDETGRFRLETPRTSTTHYYSVIALASASAAGCGLGSAELNPDAAQPSADIQLPPEQPVRVKLVDVTGMPAPGVEVCIAGVWNQTNEERYRGIYLSETPPRDLRAWPRSALTDDQGRFLLTGVGRGFTAMLSVRDLRYARQTPQVKTESPAATIALEPARIIEGRVLAEDTGQAIPNAVIAAAARIKNEHANGFFTTKFQADAEGRFQINPLSSDHYTLNAFPPAGEPYLIANDELNWSKAAVTAHHDFKLRRGVLVRGKVTADADQRGEPLAGASVQFIPTRGRDKVLSGWQAIVASGADGSFQIVVPPGKGHLLVFGPTSDYVLEATSAGMIYNGKPGGRRYYAHKFIAYDVAAGAAPVEVNAELRPGKTVKVRVVGPEGQTVTHALYFSALVIHATNPFWRGDSTNAIRDGRFELHGLDPDGTARVDILDPDHQWGASAEVSGKRSDQELTVTLQPCGSATARFLAPDGRPVVNHRPHFEFIATPGPPPFTGNKNLNAELAGDAELMPNVDRKHYWNGPLADAEGRITLPSLIPGARYRISDFSTINDADKGIQVRRDFTVKPGETLDLGDIRIDKPNE
jgi:beta-lactamase regulating signal transducer with metallopeptidase domain